MTPSERAAFIRGFGNGIVKANYYMMPFMITYGVFLSKWWATCFPSLVFVFTAATLVQDEKFAARA